MDNLKVTEMPGLLETIAGQDRESDAAGLSRSLGPYETAVVAGGRKRVIGAAVAALSRRGLLEVEDAGRTLRARGDPPSDELLACEPSMWSCWWNGLQLSSGKRLYWLLNVLVTRGSAAGMRHSESSDDWSRAVLPPRNKH